MKMKPISYRYKLKKGCQIEHCCLRCGKIQWNKVAEDTIAEDQFINFIKGMLFN
ncbi:RNHCP domain-containing protein [Carnobacterium maltaromaticum]|nr:RNHCP domain-containing protein [Carnobacterium maltaromaticum]